MWHAYPICGLMFEKYRTYGQRYSASLTMHTSVRFLPVPPWAFIYISLRLWAMVAWCSKSCSGDPQLPPFWGREMFSQRAQLRESCRYSYSWRIPWLVGLQGTLETRLPMAWSISRSRIFKAPAERRYTVVYRLSSCILIKFLRFLGSPSIQAHRENHRWRWEPFLFAMPTRKTTSIHGRVVAGQCRIRTIWRRKEIEGKAFSRNDYAPLDTHRSIPRIGAVETSGGINISDLV